MKKISIESLQKRLDTLKAMLPTPEPWPPGNEGDIAKIVYDRLRQQGYKLPEVCPVDNVFYYLLELVTPEIWLGVAPVQTGIDGIIGGGDEPGDEAEVAPIVCDQPAGAQVDGDESAPCPEIEPQTEIAVEEPEPEPADCGFVDTSLLRYGTKTEMPKVKQTARAYNIWK